MSDRHALDAGHSRALLKHCTLVPPTAGPSCTLKVQVSDLLSRRGVGGARVEVYLDYSRATAGLTGGDGVVLLPLPYREPVPNVVVVASKDGYVLVASPWKPQRMPSECWREREGG